MVNTERPTPSCCCCLLKVVHCGLAGICQSTYSPQGHFHHGAAIQIPTDVFQSPTPVVLTAFSAGEATLVQIKRVSPALPALPIPLRPRSVR